MIEARDMLSQLGSYYDLACLIFGKEAAILLTGLKWAEMELDRHDS